MKLYWLSAARQALSHSFRNLRRHSRARFGAQAAEWFKMNSNLEGCPGDPTSSGLHSLEAQVRGVNQALQGWVEGGAMQWDQGAGHSCALQQQWPLVTLDCRTLTVAAALGRHASCSGQRPHAQAAPSNSGPTHGLPASRRPAHAPTGGGSSGRTSRCPRAGSRATRGAQTRCP
jgi:hypothetical protein